jgi:hypothetical protein
MERDRFLESMEAAVARDAQRRATVHERVACPKCEAPRGARCHRPATSRATRDVGYLLFKPLKHPHRERLRADGITDR